MTSRAKVAGVVGITLHVTVVAWLYAVSGLVAPPSGLAVLAVLWVGLLVVALLLWRERPEWALAVPVAGIALWFVVLGIGDAFLGWTA